MKTISAALVIFSILPTAGFAQGVDPGSAQQRGGAAEIPSGAALVARATQSLLAQPSLAASLRYRINLYGQQMVGSGTYLQLGSGDDKLLRLELKLPVGDRVSSLQQVCDGRFLWIHRDLPGETELARIDLDRVRRAVAQDDLVEGITTPSQLAWGGVSKLIEGMAENFEFSAPGRDSIQGIPVWTIEGRWRLDRLRAMLPEQADAIESHESLADIDLPPQLPLRVRVSLGRDDLFPYRMEYLQRDTDRGNALKAIVAVEFFAVQPGIEIDPLQFVYQPGDVEVVDRTDRFINGLQR